MKFTDLFIHRPVLASVVSLLILVVGLRAIAALEVRQYPETISTLPSRNRPVVTWRRLTTRSSPSPSMTKTESPYG